MEQQIKIVVNGHCNSGVSTLVYAIKQLLSFHEGIEIEYIPNGVETKSLEEFENQVNPNIEDKINAIIGKIESKKLKITIEERQLNRQGYESKGFAKYNLEDIAKHG